MSSATSGAPIIQRGAPESQRRTAALLYDAAFGEKFALAIKDSGSRIQLFEQCFRLEHCIAALKDNQLVGIAGYSTAEGSLTSGITFKSLIEHLGWWKGLRAALVFSFYERKKVADELMMDGISVAPTHRGLGVGTQLLAELIQYGSEHQYTSIRLDVIDTNEAAKRMYERIGFVAGETAEFEYARGVLGFGASTTMIYSLDADSVKTP